MKVRKSLIKRLDDREKRFKDIIGYRVENFDGCDWVLVGTNDLGYPYFSKIVGGKAQKAQFTLSGYTSDWVKNQLAGGYGMKKIGIVGTRQRNSPNDFVIVEKTFFKIYEEGDWIVSGGCKLGADRFAEVIADKYGIPKLIFPPRWNHKYENGKFVRSDFCDKVAGFIRNTDIAEHSDILIACTSSDRKGGTEDTIKKFEGKSLRKKLGRNWGNRKHLFIVD